MSDGVRKINLKLLIADLLKKVDGAEQIESFHLFGSRAYKTNSLRSDLDILVKVPEDSRLKASALRDFAIEECNALDFFLVYGGRATSCMNDSYICATSFDHLSDKLDAVELWNKIDGFKDVYVGWVFEVYAAVNFLATSLPNAYVSELSWQTIVKKAEQLGLPTFPYIGDTVDKAAAMITEVAKKMILDPKRLGQRGLAKDGWTVDLRSEYDCQNLFYTAVKPWIPNVGREEVTIIYDDQEKIADFNFFESKLIVEMKFIDSGDKKREVVKTLDGLNRFYARNTKVEVVLFFIYVKTGVKIDADKWAADYTFFNGKPRIITHVIFVP